MVGVSPVALEATAKQIHQDGARDLVGASQIGDAYPVGAYPLAGGVGRLGIRHTWRRGGDAAFHVWWSVVNCGFCYFARGVVFRRVAGFNGVDYGIQTNTCQRLFGFQMSTGDRLREERERLGLNQEGFGALGGVKKLAQINYEKGERAPSSDYLAGLAKAGVDVLFVVTGRRLDAPLTPDEHELLALFRAAPLAVKAAAIGALQGGGAVSVGRTGGSHSQHAVGDNTVQIGSIGGKKGVKGR